MAFTAHFQRQSTGTCCGWTGPPAFIHRKLRGLVFFRIVSSARFRHSLGRNMVNSAMAKLLALRDEEMPAQLRKAARPRTFSLVFQGLGIVFWLLLCVVFWLGIAWLVF